MYIDEIFYGLQGEGERMGYPSIFVRTGICNLRCTGFGCHMKSPITGEILTGCDTIHAVHKKHFKHLWLEYNDFTKLVNDINSNIPQKLAYNEDTVDIVFTGGEPLIWHKTDVMINTIKYYLSRGHRVWFETNGTVDIDYTKYPIYKDVSFSMSVKMSASGETKEKRWKPNVVDNHLRNTKNSYFKFVLSKKSLYNEIQEIYEFLNMVPTYGTVFCMPLGETQEDLEENAKSVYEFALKNGLRYTDRLHIRIYNDERGV